MTYVTAVRRSVRTSFRKKVAAVAEISERGGNGKVESGTRVLYERVFFIICIGELSSNIKKLNDLFLSITSSPKQLSARKTIKNSS